MPDNNGSNNGSNTDPHWVHLQSRMRQLDDAIQNVLAGDEQSEDRQAISLQEEVYDLGFNSFSLSDCRRLLNDARSCSKPFVHGWKRGEDKEVDLLGGLPLWGNLLLSGGLNLLTAAPKVGKSALMVHLAACVFRGDLECLGVEIYDRFEHLIILGTDMSMAGWAKILVREGLAEYRADKRSLAWIDPRITLIDSSYEIQLNGSGIKAIRAECQRHSNSLLLVDTLRSVTTALGIDEFRPEIVKPVYALRNAVADLNVTTVVNHHENKSGTGLNAVAGSGALVGAVDVVCSMQWLNPVANGIKQTDDRRIISSAGRLSGESLVIELAKDDEAGHWVGHGSGEQVVAQLAKDKAIGELQGRDLRVMEVAWELWEVEQYLTVPICRDRCNLPKKLAENVVKKLLNRGLIEKAGMANSTGGRPSVRFKPTDEYVPISESGCGKEGKSGLCTTLHHLHHPERDGAKPVQSDNPKIVTSTNTQTDFPLPALGTVVEWRGQPAMVMEHRGFDLMVTPAIELKGEWIAKNSSTKFLARWELDAFTFTPPRPDSSWGSI